MTIETNLHLPKLLDTEGGIAPRAPTNAQNTGIDRDQLVSLTLKIAHGVPHFTGEWMSRRMLLPQIVVVNLIEELREDKLLEVKGQDDQGQYRYAISAHGRDEAERLLRVSGYTGPAPVSLDAYQAMLRHQIALFPHAELDEVREALSNLKLGEDAIEVSGMAVSSGRSLFLSGPPGNGKTSLARLLHTVMAGELWIPHSIAAGSDIICLYDPHCHHRIDPDAPANPSIDQRWVKIHRPLIVVGGEMTLKSLDLAYRDGLRYYEAPLHMKANGGTFLIDDFGRQHVEPEQLLNRWIIPMEHQFDFLALHSGQKIEVPFMLMLIFATNLNPENVTDPAFLRRIGYRLELKAPTPAFYKEIFIKYAQTFGLTPDDALIDALLERYANKGQELRACEPRDLIERVKDICQYRNSETVLTTELLDLAWTGYFGDDT